jgi:putative FmdB family regulatory protein
VAARPRIKVRKHSAFIRISRESMPLYEYECKKCHHRFERIQKFSDPHVKKCPECGGPIEQVISAPAVQFKGSGWYVTDYAKKSSTGSSSSSNSNGDSSNKDSKSSKSGESEKADSSAKTDTSKSEGSKKSEASFKKGDKR